MSGPFPTRPWQAAGSTGDPDDQADVGQLEADSGAGPQTSALARAHAEVQLDGLRRACKGAEGGKAVMDAMCLCFLHGIPVPEWLSAAFLNRALPVVHAQTKSWDDPRSFGPAWPKRTRLAQVRQDRRLMTRVHGELRRVLMADKSATLTRRGAFAAVSQLPGIGKSASGVERLYYRALATGLPDLARMRAIDNEQQSLTFRDWAGIATGSTSTDSTLNPEET